MRGMDWWSNGVMESRLQNSSLSPLHSLPIAVGPFHRKGIRQMTHLMHQAFLQEHLNDIEPDFHLGIVEQPQIVKRRACEPAAPVRIDRGRRAHPIFRRPGLNFDKYQAIAVAEN